MNSNLSILFVQENMKRNFTQQHDLELRIEPGTLEL